MVQCARKLRVGISHFFDVSTIAKYIIFLLIHLLTYFNGSAYYAVKLFGDAGSVDRLSDVGRLF